MVGTVSVFPFQFVFELNISIPSFRFTKLNRICFINEFRKKDYKKMGGPKLGENIK